MSKQHAPRIDDFVNELLGDESTDLPAQEIPAAAPPASASAPAAPLPATTTPASFQAPAMPQVPASFPLDLEKWLEPVNRDLDENPKTPPLRCVSFRLQGQYYAAEVNSLLEVLARADVVPIPSMRLPVMGILNLRGSIVTVIDPAGLLGLPSRHEEAGQLIIADYEGEAVALRVDAVGEVLSLEDEAIRNPPQAAGHVRGLAELGDDMLTLLELGRLVKKAFPGA